MTAKDPVLDVARESRDVAEEKELIRNEGEAVDSWSEIDSAENFMVPTRTRAVDAFLDARKTRFASRRS